MVAAALAAADEGLEEPAGEEDGEGGEGPDAEELGGSEGHGGCMVDRVAGLW